MKHLWFLFFAATILLTGCMNDDGKADSSNVKPEEKAIIEEKDENDAVRKKQDPFIKNPQAPNDQELTEVGKTHRDQDGVIKLLAISSEDKHVSIGPIEVTIKEAKLLNYSPSPDLIDFFHGYTHQESNFNYVKLRIVVENTSDETLNFAPVSHLETNEGEQTSFEDDFYLEKLYGDYAPGEKRYGQLGFILEQTKPENLTSIEITTSDIFKNEGSIHENQKFIIDF
ncbi:DUF4352 domain-containing protein [Pseudalkalibacillus sp. A8]|uniref:DUF4352 domain-containing protein n=1 Tax=Pseudalkalibacillus sp. A8 TaxID=3382641 RepID=UPI0038B5771E